MASSTGATKRIRLEQRVMPVSSEEELSIVTLREQNKKLSNNYNHRMRIEQDLRKRIEQLESLVRKCEESENGGESPDNQLTLVNEDLRQRVEDLEYELNKSRLTEKRLADDLERLNSEFIELRKKTTSLSMHHQATNHSSESIRHNSIATTATTNANFHGDQQQQQQQQHLNQQQYEQHNNQTSAGSNTKAFDGGTPGGGGGGTTGGGFSSGNNNNTYASGEMIVPTTVVDDNNLVLNQINTIHDLNHRLNDQNELAKNRLKELEELNEKYRDALLKIDKLQSDARCIPRETIIESAEYKTLQSHFSVLYNEATQLKTQLVESRQLMIEIKNAHLRQIERMESEDIRIQRELRTNIIDLESCLSQARDQIEELRRANDRLEQANESTLKIDTELKKSLTNYKIQIVQKNNDLQRLKRKVEEMKKHENHPNNDPDNKNPNHVANNNGENLNNSVSNHSSTNINAINPSSKAAINNSSSSSLTNNSVNNHSPSNKKIAELKEAIHQLQKQLDKTRSEEEALMQDLDVTGQAYEDMQDQNHRLLQQIEEKDEANFKLMSEHLKNNALQKHLNDEKMKLEEYGKCLLRKIDELEKVVARLEEDKKLHQEVNRKLEIEISTLKKLEDMNKKEKLELCQQLSELNLERDKIATQLNSIQKNINDKTALLTNESFRNKRLVEELDSIKKKYDRASKLQSASTPDEVLMEEIREYKEQLTCPSCKTKPKDAVLTKCFHVFCFDCLKTRVETRQRKCPKCNAQFGANDFHRLYLA